MSLRLPSDRYKRINIDNYKRPYIINIGCGLKALPDVIGIDVHDNGQAILWDVTDGIPLPDRSVKEVRMYHFLEHIEYDQLDKFFRELHRICIKGATIDIKVPYDRHPDAYALPHVSFWHEDSFKGLVRGFISSRKDRFPILKIKSMHLLEENRILHVVLEVLR